LEETVMADPVVHFEIIGKDPQKTQQFYSNLFGWNIDANNPYNYGMVDNGGKGINGGVAGNDPSGDIRTTLYVEVPDLQATLDKATSMGAKVVMPPTEIPGAVTMAMFSDQDGNVIGLVKAGSMA
jgi:predicted enzyme related to lactoylglutathione lyase